MSKYCPSAACSGGEAGMTLYQNLIAGDWVGAEVPANINSSETDNVVLREEAALPPNSSRP